MDAIVTAGGIPQPDDPLYAYSNGDSKALIDVAGKPMVQWVLDALSDAKSVDNVIVIGLSPKSGVTCKKPLHFISNQGRMLANIVAGVNKSIELDKKSKYVLVVSSDIPTLQPEMVDWLVDTCMETKDDIYYGVCPREVMEGRFPGSRRTYTKLKGLDLCGAVINVTHVRMATEHLDLWETLIGTRKSPLKQAGIIGLGCDSNARRWPRPVNVGPFCGKNEPRKRPLLKEGIDSSMPEIDHQFVLLSRLNVSRRIAMEWAALQFGLFFGFCVLFAGMYHAVTGETISISVVSIRDIGVFLLLSLLPIPLHELMHGAVMRYYGGRPRYGVGIAHFVLPYAYATSRDVYTRGQFIVIALAPLVVLSTVGGRNRVEPRAGGGD